MTVSPRIAGPSLMLILLMGASVPAWGADLIDATRTVGMGTGAVSVVSTALDKAMGERPTPVDLDLVAQVADIASNGAFIVETTAVGTTLATGSGAVIMKTIAAAGGPVMAAGATAVSAAGLMNSTLYSNCQDQAACNAARYGTYGGAALGTAASAVTVATVGAGPAGLAAIGGAVGGGMVAGVGLLVAAPVAAAAVLGGAVYWLMSD